MKKKERKIQYGKYDWLFVFSFVLLSAVCAVFSVLCLYQASNAFLQKKALLFSVLAGVLLLLFCLFSVWTFVYDKKTLCRTCLSVYLLLFIVLLLLFLLQKTGFFAIIKDKESLQVYLEKSGAWMPLIYIVLQYLQVVLLPIPGVVSTMAGVPLFGPFLAMIYSFIGIVLGAFTGFLIGRKLGYKAVSWIVGEEELNKWQEKLKGKDVFFLALMFILPCFPDDILCFVAGLSSISFGSFAVITLIARFLSVATTCYSINFIPFNTWWGLLIWACLIGILILVFFLLYKNIEKVHALFRKIFMKRKKEKEKDK